MSSRLFWPLIALASALEALAAAAFATALFSDPIPRGFTTYIPSTETELFDRLTSLDWSTDRGMSIAAIVFAFAGVAMYVATARLR